MQQIDVERSQEFRKCIECFLCQNTCHVVRDHEENKQAFAGPRFFIRAAELDMHPLDARDDRKEFAQEDQGIGYCNITKCCTEVCPEHIHITDNAIIPMKERVVDRQVRPAGVARQQDLPPGPGRRVGVLDRRRRRISEMSEVRRRRCGRYTIVSGLLPPSRSRRSGRAGWHAFPITREDMRDVDRPLNELSGPPRGTAAARPRSARPPAANQRVQLVGAEPPHVAMLDQPWLLAVRQRGA